MYEQAREFLATVLPWPENGEAFVAVMNSFVPPDYDPGPDPDNPKKLPVGGRACRSINEAIDYIDWLKKKSNTRDIWVTMSTQRKGIETKGKNGYTYYKAIRNAENAVALKSLFIDIDVKPNAYQTFDDALKALANFLKATGLPKPTTAVQSGAGIHVHWVLVENLTVEQWLPLAYALVEATKRHGLLCDAGCSTDAARVLRVPDTWNYKYDPPRPVSLGLKTGSRFFVAQIEKILEPYKVPVPTRNRGITLDPQRFPPLIEAGGNRQLTDGVVTAMPQDELRACLDAVPNNKVDWNYWNTIGMRIYAASEGEDYGLEEWERWSDKNPDAVAGTDSCIDRWETFHTSPPTHTGAGALVNEARKATGDAKWLPPREAVVTPQSNDDPTITNTLPYGYVRDKSERICTVKKGDDTEQDQLIPVSNYKMEDAWLLLSDDGHPHLNFMTNIGRKKATVGLSAEIIGGLDMRRELQRQGFMVLSGDKYPERLSNFMSAWITHLQNTTVPVKSAPFGWTEEGGKKHGFSYGGRLWTPNGDRPSASADPITRRYYTPSGELQPWIEAAKVTTEQHRPELNIIIATAFAAPLVTFTGQKGMMLSTYSSESGVGKSTALTIAQAVWGDPVKGTQSLDDTDNSTMGKMGQLKSLPVYWDELKTEDQTKKFVKITFQATQGKEKSRMNRNSEQKMVGKWQTLLVCASNASLLDYVTHNCGLTDAGLYRVFEYHIDKVPDTHAGRISSAIATRRISKLFGNYGVVGLEYAKWLGANFEKIEQEVEDHMVLVEKETGVTISERFWAHLISVLLLGARYATQLGYCDLDEASMKPFLYKVLDQMRQVKIDNPIDMTRSLDVANVLMQFINEAKDGGHVLFTNRIHQGQGKPAFGSVKVLNDPQRLPKGVWVQISTDDKLMRLSFTQLGNWCSRKQLSRHVVSTGLKKTLGFRSMTGKLGSGTGDPALTGITEHLLEIDMMGTPLINVVDGV